MNKEEPVEHHLIEEQHWKRMRVEEKTCIKSVAFKMEVRAL